MEPKAFRTLVDFPRYPYRIEHHEPLLLLGSCFAENIGQELAARKFASLSNPLGTLFNPFSVASALERLLDRRLPEASELVPHEDLWFHYDFHGDFSALSPGQALAGIGQGVERGADFLGRARHLFLTWGTSWVYELASTGQVVSNCHKQPSALFRRRRLEVDEVVARYEPLLARLRERLPGLRVLLTVSPVRHLKDGAHGNQLSKSVLLLAADRLAERCPGVAYFPSYEVLLDELRNYGFYKKDMVRPNALAVEYLWELLAEHLLSEKARATAEEMERMARAVAHRPIRVASREHQRFVLRQLEVLEGIRKKYPYVDLDSEEKCLLEQRVAP